MSSSHNATFIRLFHKMAISTSNCGFDTYIVALHPKSETINNVKIISIKSSTGFFSKLVNSYRVFIKTTKLKPDLCHIHTPLLYPFIPLLKLKKINIIVDMYENQVFSFELYNIYPSFLRKVFSFVYRNFEKLLLKNVNIIFAEDSYCEEYSWVDRYCIVLNMPILNKLNKIQVQKKQTPTCGYIGGLSKERGILNLIKSIEILKNRNVIVNLELIGTGTNNFLKECEDLIEKNSLQEQITFYGFLEPNEAYQIVSKWWVGLATLLPMKNYYNSYPTKIFEYMALQMPIIVSNFPLYEKVILNHGCGLAVNPLNLIDIAGSIETICNNDKLRYEFSKNGLNAVNTQYSWDIEQKKLLKFYNEILS